MSPFPAAIARARSEFGAGSGFVVAVKPPCTIGKTSQLVMFLSLAIRGPRKGVSKSLLITKVRSVGGKFLDESGSVVLKPCMEASQVARGAGDSIKPGAQAPGSKDKKTTSP